MTIRRTVPNIQSKHPAKSRNFYLDFLGLEVAMEREEIITFASTSNPTAQISIILPSDLNSPHPDVSVEVADIDTVHNKAVEQGIEIIYPLTDEPWGVRRFFVRDPDGAIINILSHS